MTKPTFPLVESTVSSHIIQALLQHWLEDWSIATMFHREFTTQHIHQIKPCDGPKVTLRPMLIKEKGKWIYLVELWKKIFQKVKFWRWSISTSKKTCWQISDVLEDAADVKGAFKVLILLEIVISANPYCRSPGDN